MGRYLQYETGARATAHRYTIALRSVGVEVMPEQVSELSPNCPEAPVLLSVACGQPYDVNLVFLTADGRFANLEDTGAEMSKDRYNVGIWSLDYPEFPCERLDRFACFGEIWVATSFMANSLAPLSPIPVLRIPPVFASQAEGSREEGRSRLGVRPGVTVFLSVFNFRSYPKRSNPLTLIEAFKLAFGKDETVRLVIACVNEDFAPEAFEEMETRTRGYPISVYAGRGTADGMADLMAACDAYVSLHRLEGSGLHIADAMAAAKPVIATGWSGNMDFMTNENSFPVSFDLVELKGDVGIYRTGEVWAEPRVEHAAKLMRFVLENRDEARARGEAARRDIEREYSNERIGHLVEQRLKVVAQRMESQPKLQPAAPAGCDVPDDRAHAPITSGRSAADLNAPIIPPMEFDASLYGPFGRLGKRIVSFLLSYHTYYQSNINLSFAAFMHELAGASEGMANRLADVEQSVDRLSGAYEGMANRLADIEQAVARLNYRFAVRPHMASDAFGAMGDLSQPMGYSLDAKDSQPGADEFGFAGLFRGSEEFIARRQRVYLPFFAGLADVVDLGCGRGEFLRLLAEKGISAVGVELDSRLVQYCRGQGHQVVEGDALDYLRSLPEGSLDAIFSAQFIEHLEPKQLMDLLALARSRLRKKGIFIAETVNPESHEALKTFHVDLSHQRPIFPQTLLCLCLEVGFPASQVFYPLGGGFTQVNYQTAGEYAVVARA